MSFTSNYAGDLGSLFLCASLGSPPFHLVALGLRPAAFPLLVRCFCVRRPSARSLLVLVFQRHFLVPVLFALPVRLRLFAC